MSRTLETSAKDLVRAIAPEEVLRAYRAARLVYRARRLALSAARVDAPAALVDLVFSQEDFRPVQVRSEITALLERIAKVRPERVLEIGSALGGTAFLLARVASPDANLVLVDRVFGPGRRLAIRQLTRRGQRMTCICGDSQLPVTVARVLAHFRSSPVDFLFIDADHSYQGVVTDFKSYSRFVRKGGWIGFHDIVADHWTRFGRRTSASAGEVFRFWHELKSRRGLTTTEIVENPDQDGAGIGLLRWDPAAGDAW